MTQSQRDEADKIVKKIADYCKPEKIYIYGSMARGEAKRNSDLDLLIVKDSNEKRPFRAKEVFEALRGFDRKLTIDPIVYTQNELNERMQMGDYFVKEMLEQGQLVYGY